MTTKVSLIADDSVKTGTILNGTVNSEDLNSTAGSQAVTTNTIRDGAVTNTKLAAASVTADKLASGVAIPSGVIVMWSGTATPYNATTNPRGIPTGWALCNGENGTPDLRDRFIVGAGSAYTPGNTGGANSVTLDSTQMPYHNHTASDSGHSHPLYNQIGGAGNSVGGGGSNTSDQSSGTGYASITVGYAGGSNGVTQAHENRPPYYALAFIMRVL